MKVCPEPFALSQVVAVQGTQHMLTQSIHQQDQQACPVAQGGTREVMSFG